MKLSNSLLAIIAIGLIVSSTSAPAQNLYFNNFSNATVGYNGIPGFTITTTGPNTLSSQVFAATDTQNVSYFFTDAGLPVPTDGTKVVSPYGFPNGTGVDTLTYTLSANNLGTFQSGITYTFSMLVGTGNASHNPTAFLDIEDFDTDTVLNSISINPPSENALSKYSVSYLATPDVAGDDIGIAFGLTSTIGSNNAQLDAKFTDALLVAPEPSSYLLLLSGVVVLFVSRRRMIRG